MERENPVLQWTLSSPVSSHVDSSNSLTHCAEMSTMASRHGKFSWLVVPIHRGLFNGARRRLCGCSGVVHRSCHHGRLVLVAQRTGNQVETHLGLESECLVVRLPCCTTVVALSVWELQLLYYTAKLLILPTYPSPQPQHVRKCIKHRFIFRMADKTRQRKQTTGKRVRVTCCHL